MADSITGGGVMKPVTAPGNAPIVKVGQTYSGKFGSEPDAKVMGNKTIPTPQTFG